MNNLNVNDLEEIEESPSILSEAISENVDRLLLNEIPKNNDLLPPKARHAMLVREMQSNVNFIELGDIIASAINHLILDGNRYLSREEYEDLLKSLDLLADNLDELDLQGISEETALKVFAIPEETQGQILKISIAKFNEGLIQESFALLTFLTLLSPNEPDYWIRLGLVAQRIKKYDLASKAFSAAAELAPDFIGSHIFAADCYRLRDMPDQARDELTTAKAIYEKTDIHSEWHEQMASIESLLK